MGNFSFLFGKTDLRRQVSDTFAKLVQYFYYIVNGDFVFSKKNTYTYSPLYLTMATTIQVSKELQRELMKRKLFDRETYEEVIWDLIEDCMELSERTIEELQRSREEIRSGKSHTLLEVKKELGL